MSDIARDGARAAGSVTVDSLGPQGMISVRAKMDDPALASALTELGGLSVPGPLYMSRSGEMAVLWMGPDEVMVLCAYNAAQLLSEKLAASLSGAHALAANVSDARAMFRLTGPENEVREALAKLTPADCAPDALPEGRVRRTRLAQVAGAIWIEEGAANVIAFRSGADYVFGLLKTAAADSAKVGYF